jgi:hypothetical protein
MTKYLLSVYPTPEDWEQFNPDEPPPEDVQQLYAAVEAFNEEVKASGAWVFAGGLHPPATATVVDAVGVDVTITDGPYAETKEQIGGFWIVDVADLDAALELAKKGSAACAGKVEVRPFQDDAG